MQKCKYRLYTATASLSDVYTENGVKLILMKFIIVYIRILSHSEVAILLTNTVENGDNCCDNDKYYHKV